MKSRVIKPKSNRPKGAENMFSMVEKNRANRKEGPPGVNDGKGRKVQ
jgi:hypothetical protein